MTRQFENPANAEINSRTHRKFTHPGSNNTFSTADRTS
jgi:hypothetical protein